MDDFMMDSLRKWCIKECTHGDVFLIEDALKLSSALDDFVYEYPDMAARKSWREMQDSIFVQERLADLKYGRGA